MLQRHPIEARIYFPLRICLMLPCSYHPDHQASGRIALDAAFFLSSKFMCAGMQKKTKKTKKNKKKQKTNPKPFRFHEAKPHSVPAGFRTSLSRTSISRFTFGTCGRQRTFSSSTRLLCRLCICLHLPLPPPPPSPKLQTVRCWLQLHFPPHFHPLLLTAPSFSGS
jgi:hypothetical protein